MMTDNHGRKVDYLRLSVTDNCNLRCRYCMPEEGIAFTRRKDLLSWEEMFRLVRIFVDLGVSKVRITGGEPFVRKGLTAFLLQLTRIEGLKDVSITTNATLLGPELQALRESGIRNLNISLDSLNPERFFQICRRDYFHRVLGNLEEALRMQFNVKLNCIVLKDRNIQDIIPFLEYSRDKDLQVRFLEEMPFNGSGEEFEGIEWDFHAILNHIESHYGKMIKLEGDPRATATYYSIEGGAIVFGVIPAFSRTFCATCNRLRVSAKGELRTCLYAGGHTSLRDLMREGATDVQVKNSILKEVGSRHADGFEAERQSKTKISMSYLGG